MVLLIAAFSNTKFWSRIAKSFVSPHRLAWMHSFASQSFRHLHLCSTALLFEIHITYQSGQDSPHNIDIYSYYGHQPIPVAERSKAWVCSRSLAGAEALNPVGHGCLSPVNVVCCQVEVSASS